MKKLGLKITEALVVLVALAGLSACKPETVYVDKIVEKPIYTNKTTQAATKVLHMQQSENGLSYVKIEEESKSVAKDTELASISKNFKGFNAIGIFQNGETVTVLYNRNIITYSFQTGSEGKFSDGTTEKVVKGLYGAPVSAPIATSSTHNFGGWFTSENVAPGSTYGEEDLTFVVKWIPIDSGDFNWYEIPIDVETGEMATSSSTYVYFGVFPKTVLPSDSAVSVDETVKKVMGTNTYYKGNDGNYYEKVVAHTYGAYKYTDDSASINGVARYFRVEPIKWKVLTNSYNGKSLLVAEEIITAMEYHKGKKKNTIFANNYKYSTIRAYLNGVYESDDPQDKTYAGKGFLQTAFTSSAQLLIATTTVDNSAETTDYSESTYAFAYACENTEDKIFLLSTSEVINSSYGFEAYNKHGVGNARIRVTTDYAKANYAHQSTVAGYGGCWWLRSPQYKNGSDVRGVDYYGSLTGLIADNHIFPGIVPALCLSLD